VVLDDDVAVKERHDDEGGGVRGAAGERAEADHDEQLPEERRRGSGFHSG